MQEHVEPAPPNPDLVVAWQLFLALFYGILVVGTIVGALWLIIMHFLWFLYAAVGLGGLGIMMGIGCSTFHSIHGHYPDEVKH